MDAKIKADWLAALRSGDYEQGRGQLCDAEGRMCCLGVLYDVAHDGDWEERGNLWFTDDGNYWRWGTAVAGGDKTTRLLADMNDGVCGEQRQTFAEIADWIEREL